ncbi:MAG: DUF2971 domain-containing protein [uncultured Clostridium sp.]
MVEKMGKCIDEWIRIPQCVEGDKIYHYTTVDGIKGILENNEFWVTKSDFLNDRLEFKYSLDILKEVAELYIKNTNIKEKFIKYVADEFERINNDTNGLLSGYYVLSFSKIQDSMLLWAEYSDFMGYCIEFDFNKFKLAMGEKTSLHGEVIYNKEQQRKLVKETLEKTIAEFNEANNEFKNLFKENPSISDESLKKLTDYVAVWIYVYGMFFKKECFKGEGEYRFVFSAFHERSDKYTKLNVEDMYFRERDQVLIPYIKIKYDKSKLPVESVLVGTKNNSDIAVKGIKYFLRKEKMDIPVYKSEIPLRY